MNVSDLAKWHLDQAIAAGKRVLGASGATEEAKRKAQSFYQDQVSFHSDAVELLSDLMDAESDVALEELINESPFRNLVIRERE